MDHLRAKTKEFRTEFRQHDKRFLRSNKTNSPALRLEYTKNFITSYNSYIALINSYFDKIGFDDKTTVRLDFQFFKNCAFQYAGAYNISDLPIPIDGYTPILISDQELEHLIVEGLRPKSPLETEPVVTDNPEKSSQTENEENNTTKMTDMSKIDFINTCARHMSTNYDGKFETLRSFINKINFLKTLATNDALNNTLKAYILTKLDQTALSKLPTNPSSVDVIISCLESKVKHESSKVLEGRMIALTLDNKSLIEFQSQAKILADNYQQSLVEDGYPLALAEKMAIEKTVDLCRKNTKSPEVKAVLSSTAHTDPASVIAKMVTQIDIARQEKLLATGTKYKSDKFQNPRGSFSRGNGRGGRGRGYYSNNHDRGNNGNNAIGNQNGSRGSGFSRGRGRGRGNNNGNGRSGFYSQPFNGQQNQYDQQVLFTQGNGQMPLPQGAQQQQNSTNVQRM